MTIERISMPDPISKYTKTGKAAKSAKSESKDSINLSSEAKTRAEVYNATETAKSAPELRMDKIAEIKKKLEDPSYIDNAVIEAVADRIMSDFGI